MRRALLLAVLLASPAVARREVVIPVCAEPVKPVLFISPMGEPFRPKTGDDAAGDDPVRRWFDQADRNKDGKLTVGELMLDGDRFFATIDKDKSGELLPDEVAAYEQDVAPEIRLYQRRPERKPDADGKPEDDRRQQQAKRKKPAPLPPGVDGAQGAGRYAFLNIPNPVAAADRDINRAVTQQEFRAAAAERFADLDPKQSKALTFDQLPKTPAQIMANFACVQRLKDQAKEKRR
jgi:hypothetical protein